MPVAGVITGVATEVFCVVIVKTLVAVADTLIPVFNPMALMVTFPVMVNGPVYNFVIVFNVVPGVFPVLVKWIVAPGVGQVMVTV